MFKATGDGPFTPNPTLAVIAVAPVAVPATAFAFARMLVILNVRAYVAVVVPGGTTGMFENVIVFPLTIPGKTLGVAAV
jgi:hypothetical protein